jgi:hypothetical protein
MRYENGYSDVFVEYTNESPENIEISVYNRGRETVEMQLRGGQANGNKRAKMTQVIFQKSFMYNALLISNFES